MVANTIPSHWERDMSTIEKLKKKFNEKLQAFADKITEFSFR